MKIIGIFIVSFFIFYGSAAAIGAWVGFAYNSYESIINLLEKGNKK